MAKKANATEQDRIAVARLVLAALARDEPLDDVLRKLRSFADYTFPFPGDVLTEIAATALQIAGATAGEIDLRRNRRPTRRVARRRP